MVGGGEDVAGVQMSEEAEDGVGVADLKESAHLHVNSPYAEGSRSLSSSTTTISRPSPPPSVDIRVTSSPPYDPIDVSDEGRPGERGQEDRKDGRVEEVFELHSSRRMKPTSRGQGISIPSRKF